MRAQPPLVIEIFLQAEVLKMSIFEASGPASTLRHYSLVSFDHAQIAQLGNEIFSFLHNACRQQMPVVFIDRFQQNCHLLWHQLLSPQVRQRLEASGPAELLLLLDEELVAIPWELLYDGREYLCRRFGVGRLIRTKSTAAASRLRSLAPKPRMLILANPTNDLPAAYQEGVQIKNQLSRLTGKLVVDFKSTDIPLRYLKQHLSGYDLVHFAGHCEADASGAPGWILSDGSFCGSDVRQMAGSLSLPSLIFSNACCGAGVAAPEDQRLPAEATYQLAGAFLFSGVQHYVGTVGKVDDETAFAFAREFYSQITAGESIGESLRRARAHQPAGVPATGFGWAGYVLYGDPQYVLFPRSAAGGVRWPLSSRTKQRVATAAALLALVAACMGFLWWMPAFYPQTKITFLKARLLFSQGKNQQVVRLSQQLINREPSFLGAYPLLADASLKLGDTQKALAYYFDYCLQSQKRRDTRHLLAGYLGVGWVYQLRREYSLSDEFYQKALGLSRATGDQLNEARALRKMAVWNIDQKDYAMALELLCKSSELNRQHQDNPEFRYNLACDYFDQGLIFTNRNDYPAARVFYEKSRRLFEGMRLENELSDCYFNLGELCLFEKQYLQALEHYQRGLLIDLRHDNKLALASDYVMLGELYLEMKKYPEAKAALERAITIATNCSLSNELTDAYRCLSQLYAAQGKRLQARQLWEQAEGLSKE